MKMKNPNCIISIIYWFVSIPDNQYIPRVQFASGGAEMWLLVSVIVVGLGFLIEISSYLDINNHW